MRPKYPFKYRSLIGTLSLEKWGLMGTSSPRGLRGATHPLKKMKHKCADLTE